MAHTPRRPKQNIYQFFDKYLLHFQPWPNNLGGKKNLQKYAWKPILLETTAQHNASADFIKNYFR